MLVMTWHSMRLRKKSLRPQPNEMLPFSRLGLRRRFSGSAVGTNSIPWKSPQFVVAQLLFPPCSRVSGFPFIVKRLDLILLPPALFVTIDPLSFRP